MSEGIDRFGVGDLRLTPEFELLRQARHGIGLAASVTLGLPTASSADFVGQRGASLGPKLLVSRSFGGLRTAANLSYETRRDAKLVDLHIADRGPAARIGAAYQTATANPTEVSLTASLASPAGSFLEHANLDHVELLAGVQQAIGPNWLPFLAGRCRDWPGLRDARLARPGRGPLPRRAVAAEPPGPRGRAGRRCAAGRL